MRRRLTVAIGGALWLSTMGPVACQRPRIVPSVPPISFATGEPVVITQRTADIAPPPVLPVVRRQVAVLTIVARTRLTPANVPRGTRLRFELFEDLNVTAVVDHVEVDRDNGVTLVATGESHPGHVALTYAAGQLAVLFALPTEGDIEVVPFSATDLLVSQMEKQLRVSCEASGRHRPPRPPRTTSPLASNQPSQIDIGVMYTDAALCRLRPTSECPNEQWLSVKLRTWAMLSSRYFTCSGINARLNVVAIKKVSYQESGSLTTDLTRFNSPEASPGTDVAQFRTANQADVVLVLVADGDNYGLAEVFTTDYTVDQFKQIATGVVIAQAAFGHTLVHEVGHILGAGHQQGHGTGRYAYSHGNVLRSRSGNHPTLMAQGRGSLVTLFTGPDVPFGKGSTGSPTIDNARTINETRQLVEGFQVSNRTPTPAVPCSRILYRVLSGTALPLEQRTTVPLR